MELLRRGKRPPQDAENETVDHTRRDDEEDGIVYPHGLKLALIMTSAYLSMFLVALVRAPERIGLTS
jgi:hypothetical protein